MVFNPLSHFLTTKVANSVHNEPWLYAGTADGAQ